MKNLMSCFILCACQLCFAVGDTNIIVISDWSEPISLRNESLHDEVIRGRLLIVEGMEPAYGGPPRANGAMTFVELQNITHACCDGIDVCFDVMKLNCELTDATGKAVFKPVDGPWGGRGPFAPSWVKLPYNSTIRLFVNGGTRDPLAVYPSGEPWRHWSIVANDTNTYFLSGTLSLSTHTNLSLSPQFREMDYQKHGTATLTFPKTRITAARMGDQPSIFQEKSLNALCREMAEGDGISEGEAKMVVLKAWKTIWRPDTKADIASCEAHRDGDSWIASIRDQTLIGAPGCMVTITKAGTLLKIEYIRGA